MTERYLVKRINRERWTADRERRSHIADIPILGEVDAVILTACGRKLAWTEWRVTQDSSEALQRIPCKRCWK